MNRSALLMQAIRGPLVLITLGILFAVQQSGMISFSRTWPLLLIVIGVAKLLERMFGGPIIGTNGGPNSGPFARPSAGPSQSNAQPNAQPNPQPNVQPRPGGLPQ